MQKNGVIKNKISTLYDKLSKLTKIQKLLLSIILLIIIVMISKGVPTLFEDRSIHYNYNKEDMSTYNLLQENVIDNNLFITLKKIADDFFNKTTQYDDGKLITENDIYNNCLTKEYKDNISKSDFKKLYNQTVEKINKIKTVYGEIVPNSITVDADGFYILKYSYTIDNENVELYVGILLNQNVKKYYIWYLE